MLAVAMLALGMGLGALIAAALYATELKRIATFLRTRNKHSNARVTAGTPAPGIHELASVINDGLEETSRERIEALRSQEEFQRDLSALSHDIRTPLTGAKGYLQLALDETDDDVRTHHLDAAAARIDSTTELLDALFAYTKSTDPDLSLMPEVVEVEAAIEQALLAHYPEFEARGWEPHVSCAKDATIFADRDALARIFDNLIVNALRHGADAPRTMGFDYAYVEAGNDVQALVDALESLRGTDRPVVLHIHTKKGAGYAPAERAPELWHHVGPFDLETGEKRKLIGGDVPAGGYADLTARHLLERMARDQRVVAITAGMPYVLGFTPERRAQAGSQFVDVGIAEEHAVTCSAALATGGAKPVFGVYGAFLQRAYDELWHDLCLNSAPATIVDIGASVFGANAETHLNFFDLAMLSGLPNLRVLAPTCLEEYLAMLDWSLDQQDMPVVIRMPVGSPVSRPELAPADHATFGMPSYQVVREGADVAILALGGFFSLGEQVAEALAPHDVQATLVNPRFATELDEDFLSTLPERHRVVVTLEDGVLEGGWGEKVARFLATTDVRTRCYGIPRNFYDRFDPQELLASCGITVEGIANDTLKLLRA